MTENSPVVSFFVVLLFISSFRVLLAGVSVTITNWLELSEKGHYCITHYCIEYCLIDNTMVCIILFPIIDSLFPLLLTYPLH